MTERNYAWYFDAYEITRVELVGDRSKPSTAINHRGRIVLAADSSLAESFQQAKNGQLLLIVAEIETIRIQSAILDERLCNALNRMSHALADDEGAHEDE